MGSGGASVPPPPEMTPEERNLLTQQNLTLQQFRSLLEGERGQSQETQNILKGISGLYENVDVPESTKAGQDAFSQDKANRLLGTKNINEIPDAIRKDVALAISSPYGGVGVAVDPKKLQAIIERAKGDIEFARQIGLTEKGPDQVVAAHKELRLSQPAVEKLKGRLDAQIKTQQEFEDLVADRTRKALLGQLPVSQGTMQRKADEFNLLRESAARRGIKISGDTPESATSQSTSGNELLKGFKQTYGLIEDQERRGELAGVPGYFSGAYAPTSLNLLTGASDVGPGRLLGGYSSLAGMYGGATGPYANQRGLQYQGLLQNASLRNQGIGAISGLLGYGGAAAMGTNPWLGAGLIGAGALYGLR